MEGNELRNPDGTFAKGCVANPDGKNGHAEGWTPYGLRIQRWMEKPAVEIKAIIGDMDRLEALSSIDVICIKHVTKMMFGKDALKALQIALERIEGAPKQTIKIGGDGGEAIKVDNKDVTQQVLKMIPIEKLQEIASKSDEDNA